MDGKKNKYPVGIQDFEKVRKEDYVYVDKTMYIHELVSSGAYFFLSRPRRFGKSLLLSTMKAYFEGKRELFKGLAMETLEHDWKEYPVLYLDLNTQIYKETADLEERLDTSLHEWELLYGGAPERSLPLRFEAVIRKACEKTGCRVVILVDEYDKPLLQTIGNEEVQDNYRTLLKAFYSNLKSMDGCIQFAFLTGVTKFSKVSIFSDLNNINDISMEIAQAGICGITETELRKYFAPTIEELAAKEKMGYEEMLQLLKEHYDGYRFTMEKSEGIYNPFSLLNAFYKNRIGDYWFESGTPTFLVELLKRCDYDLRQLQEELVDENVINSVDSMMVNPIPVIYQSGYLTIKDYNNRFKTYRLGFPNKEVEEGFMKYILPYSHPNCKSAAMLS